MMWIVFGILSIVCFLANVLFCLAKKLEYCEQLVFFSLMFAVLTFTADLNLINGWVTMQDWSALMDVIPFLSIMMTVAGCLCVVFNGVLLSYSLHEKKKMNSSS